VKRRPLYDALRIFLMGLTDGIETPALLVGAIVAATLLAGLAGTGVSTVVIIALLATLVAGGLAITRTVRSGTTVGEAQQSRTRIGLVLGAVLLPALLIGFAGLVEWRPGRLSSRTTVELIDADTKRPIANERITVDIAGKEHVVTSDDRGMISLAAGSKDWARILPSSRYEGTSVLFASGHTTVSLRPKDAVLQVWTGRWISVDTGADALIISGNNDNSYRVQYSHWDPHRPLSTVLTCKPASKSILDCGSAKLELSDDAILVLRSQVVGAERVSTWTRIK
jgi:hypothetical protein